jgi:hypothetical protein
MDTLVVIERLKHELLLFPVSWLATRTTLSHLDYARTASPTTGYRQALGSWTRLAIGAGVDPFRRVECRDVQQLSGGLDHLLADLGDILSWELGDLARLIRFISSVLLCRVAAGRIS